jgi:hypothetical protein
MFWQAHKKLPCIPEIQAIRPAAHDNIMICDVAGFAEQAIGTPRVTPDFIHKLKNGDLSCVADSDAFLAELEKVTIASRTFVPRNDVLGAVPIVPNFIAGNPFNMRRRERVRKPKGPLAIFLECTGSGSTMHGDTLLRGVAMLALARLLNDQRPIDLYVCVTFGKTNRMNAIVCRVETAPLDLARAAFMLGNLTDMSRVGFDVIEKTIGEEPGSWSYGTPDLERRWCGEIFGRFLQPGSEVLFCPAAFTTDAENPVAWIKQMLVKYGGDTVEREDGEEAAADNETGFDSTTNTFTADTEAARAYEAIRARRRANREAAERAQAAQALAEQAARRNTLTFPAPAPEPAQYRPKRRRRRRFY